MDCYDAKMVAVSVAGCLVVALKNRPYYNCVIMIAISEVIRKESIA